MFSGSSLHPPLLCSPQSPQPRTASGPFAPDSAQNRIDISLVESNDGEAVRLIYVLSLTGPDCVSFFVIFEFQEGAVPCLSPSTVRMIVV